MGRLGAAPADFWLPMEIGGELGLIVLDIELPKETLRRDLSLGLGLSLEVRIEAGVELDLAPERPGLTGLVGGTGGVVGYKGLKFPLSIGPALSFRF